ncbi:Ig-like domain-containing protein [Winogradskyella litorisediminis]|uniref:Ig-like domain-containing protein n=1 Tax=Winogradskyella litorisediminis TaxID=1156618 RepID=A0ABW3N5Z4_9FLAO
MSKSLKLFTSVIAAMLLVFACASRGRPSGGEKDTTPPEIVSESPANFSTNFNAEEIRIYFDEYVKIKDLQKQLIISPPLKYQPTIYPQGSASKYISIKIKDTLQPNTTYAFNFGNSIVDNNEENPFRYYRYVFSTGSTIDSLSVQGAVFDAKARTADPFISVMLYEVDTTYTDSTVYKQKPKFVTNTLDSLTTFNIENIKAGKYKLIALKDKNGNFTYEPKQDKIGFYEGTITVPTDSFYNITLFKEVPDFKVFKPGQVAEQRIQFPYEGNFNPVEIEVQSDSIKNLQYRITHDKEKDTLYYWYKPLVEVDSASFLVKNETFTETFKYKFKEADKDSLIISAKKPSLGFNDIATITATTPFEKIDSTKITIINNDSIPVKYRVEFDRLYNNYKFKFELEESEKYKMQALPNAFTDFYGAVNDTLNFNFSTRRKSEFGSIRVNLINAKFPLIVQLVDTQGKVLYERYTDEFPIVDFNNIDAKQYQLRAIFDTNKNGKYDTGDFLKKIQPERVSYYPTLEDTDVRANFEYVITFTLND